LEVPYPSKVRLPVRRPAIVRRERLIEALSRARERRITLISAPAGYGKTTLLLDFAQAAREPVCWYSLDEGDRDRESFLRYLLASARERQADFGLELAAELTSLDSIDPDRAVELLVLAMQARPPLTFVLDDFHFLDQAPADLQQIIEGWLYRLPPDCHVILSGRTQPQLGILPLMSVRQEVDTIGAADFSFTCDEVVHLFRDVLGRDVSLDDAQHLADVSEGWAGALVLLADRVQMSRTAITLEHLRGSDTLFQYVKLEQFDPLPSDLKEFLTGSAVPRWLNEEFLDELLSSKDAEERLNQLRRLNLFVLTDNENGRRQRYHRLFRAFLVSHLRSQQPERFHELNVRAAELMEKDEQWEEAVYHYIQAGRWERIVRVTDKVGWQMFEEGRWDTLAEWLDAVPEEQLARNPKLMLWKARILHNVSQIDQALSLLSRAIASFEANQEWVLQAEALVIEGMCLRAKGEHEASKNSLKKAEALLLAHDGPAPLLIEARKQLGISLNWCGELKQAEMELRGVLDIYEAKGDVYNVALVADDLAIAVAQMGRLADAAIYFERARQCWLKLGNDAAHLRTVNNLGVLYYLQGEFDQAETVLGEGLDRAGRITNARPEMYLRQNLADVKRDRGEYEQAVEMYFEALRLAQTMDEALISSYISDGVAKTYRLMGDDGNAEAWALRALAMAEEKGGALELGVSSTTLGLIKRDAGDLKAATVSLERAVELLRSSEAKRELAAALFHLASVHFSLKRKKLALEALEEVAKLVSELGYDHFVRMEAARNPLLVQYAAANKLAGEYYGRLLKTMKGSRKAAVPVQVEAMESEHEMQAEAGLMAYGFGNVRVEIGGREITDLEWRSEKSKEMFFFFLCNRRPLRKEEIVAALWPDLPDEKTTSAFHSNMYRLRKALYPEVIAKDSGRYILDPRSQFAFDVERFQELLAKAGMLPKGSTEAASTMEQALECYDGPFAMDFYSEWAETLRWQLAEQHMSLLTTLAAFYSDAKEYKRSAEICQRILELDEYNEAAWYRLMSNYIHSGQTEAARFCYKRYVQVLGSEDLGDEVPSFEDLQRQMARTG
jgi:LuxR family transcriptional regulator, maltose regulon positive regulatory protein